MSKSGKGKRSSRLSFLNLPPEIRLEVYPHLLVATETSYEIYGHEPTWPNYDERRGANCIGTSEPCPIRIRSTRSGVDPTTISILRIDNPPYSDEEPLFPEILSTCRTISKEATPILYQENTFFFTNPDSDWDVEDPFERLPFSARHACKNLMSYSIFDWDLNVPLLIRTSSLAAFLRKVGPVNAALIPALHIGSENTAQASDDINIASALCAHHMPKLRKLKLKVQEK
ncbi:MAG: hypothetical protein Q9226_005386 [Calogaya cf. arnoldii]